MAAVPTSRAKLVPQSAGIAPEFLRRRRAIGTALVMLSRCNQRVFE
jgi:hypothetical protein